MNDSLPTDRQFSLANGVAVPIFGENRVSLPISAENRELAKTVGDLSAELARFDSQFARVPVDDGLRIEGRSLH
ncbi:MAG: hypothetical protein HY000_26685, partial [Planctomycetes bacterium]|nr:hypothetical protein [Planctomycetota bacterium]